MQTPETPKALHLLTCVSFQFSRRRDFVINWKARRTKAGGIILHSFPMVLSPDSWKHNHLSRGMGAGLAILENVYFILGAPAVLLQTIAPIPNAAHEPFIFFRTNYCCILFMFQSEEGYSFHVESATTNESQSYSLRRCTRFALWQVACVEYQVPSPPIY